MQELNGARLPSCCDQQCEKESEIQSLRALINECDLKIRSLTAALGEQAGPREHRPEEAPTANLDAPKHKHVPEVGEQPLAKRAYTKDRLTPENAAKIRVEMQKLLREQGPLTVNQIMSAIVTDFAFTKSQLQSIVYKEASSPDSLIQRAGRAPFNNEVVVSLRVERNAT
ncbi:hypothetical protein [Pelagibacterium sp.]|uniref:hypothetical protein n=1 Tax=Pelagibacterium sp. TaxID=1967288 RepID=UPI003A93A2A4